MPTPEEQNTLPTPLEQGISPTPVDQNILPTPVEQPTLPTPVQSCPDLSSPGSQDLFPSPTQQLMNQNSPQANYPTLPPTQGSLPPFQETLPQVHEKLPPIQGKLPSIQEFMNPDPVMPRQQHSGKQQLLQNIGYLLWEIFHKIVTQIYLLVHFRVELPFKVMFFSLWSVFDMI